MKAIKHTPQKNRSLVILLSIFSVIFLLVFLHVRNLQIQMINITSDINESVPIPVFSVPQGIYDDKFELEIFAPDDYIIFYTTDGSTPTTKSKRYSRPIKINPQVNLNKEILGII